MKTPVLLIFALLLLSPFVFAQGNKPQKPDPERIIAIKEQNARAIQLNSIITRFNSAVAGKDWQAAADAAAELIAIEPRWDFFAGLGNAQYNLRKYPDAAASYEDAVQKAGSWAEIKIANVERRTAVSRALTFQGNSYLKLRKNDEAMRSFSKAAEIDPNPGLAYFNLCATQYNMGNMDAAIDACGKSIAADPTRADAYFIKGSALYGSGKLDAAGKYGLQPVTSPPPGSFIRSRSHSSRPVDRSREGCRE